MKIVLQQDEFEQMAGKWVFENLVEKEMHSAAIVNDTIELEVFGEGQAPLEFNPKDEDGDPDNE